MQRTEDSPAPSETAPALLQCDECKQLTAAQYFCTIEIKKGRKKTETRRICLFCFDHVQKRKKEEERYRPPKLKGGNSIFKKQAFAEAWKLVVLVCVGLAGVGYGIIKGVQAYNKHQEKKLAEARAVAAQQAAEKEAQKAANPTDPNAKTADGKKADASKDPKAATAAAATGTKDPKKAAASDPKNPNGMVGATVAGGGNGGVADGAPTKPLTKAEAIVVDDKDPINRKIEQAKGKSEKGDEKKDTASADAKGQPATSGEKNKAEKDKQEKDGSQTADAGKPEEAGKEKSGAEVMANGEKKSAAETIKEIKKLAGGAKLKSSAEAAVLEEEYVEETEKEKAERNRFSSASSPFGNREQTQALQGNLSKVASKAAPKLTKFANIAANLTEVASRFTPKTDWSGPLQRVKGRRPSGNQMKGDINLEGGNGADVFDELMAEAEDADKAAGVKGNSGGFTASQDALDRKNGVKPGTKPGAPGSKDAAKGSIAKKPDPKGTKPVIDPKTGKPVAGSAAALANAAAKPPVKPAPPKDPLKSAAAALAASKKAAVGYQPRVIRDVEVTPGITPMTQQSVRAQMAALPPALQGEVMVMDMAGDKLFQPGSVELTKEVEQEMKEIIAVLSAKPNLPVLVQCFTDSRGQEEMNITMSRLRAEAVRNYLAKRLNLRPENLTVIGMGASKPVAAEVNPDGTDNPGGRAQNRRVSITIPKLPDVEPEAEETAQVAAAPATPVQPGPPQPRRVQAETIQQ